MTDEYKSEYTTLGIGSAGVYATGRTVVGLNSTTTSSSSIPDRRLTPYLGDMVEGGIVLDKRPCIHRDDFVHMIVSGPMMNQDLPHDSKKGWGPTESCDLEDARKCKGLDYLSLNLYIQLWVEKGARVGVRVGDKVYWNDGPNYGFGKIQDIPLAESRWQWDDPIE
jgi:hypothetical protein